VPAGDVVALRQAIQRLLDDNALHRRFSTAARERVQKQFTLDKMARCTLQLYEAALRENVSVLESELAAAHD
jgi:glycosyltransferase involved in cell wall biosynthesis